MWWRLAIVLSGLWMAGGTAWQWVASDRAAERWAGEAENDRTKCLRDGEAHAGWCHLIFYRTRQNIGYRAEQAKLEGAVWTAGLAVAAWLLVFLSRYLTRWILAGGRA